MPQQASVAEIFEHVPHSINLIGFPYSKVLSDLQDLLGHETLLKTDRRRNVYSRRVVNPSFPLKNIKQRQDFFSRIGCGKRIKKTFFDKELPQTDFSSYKSNKNFLELCDLVYDILKTARTELDDFNHMPETKKLLSRIDRFDSQLEAILDKLDSIERIRTFAIDTDKGIITSISKMPDGKTLDLVTDKGDSRHDGEWNSYLFNQVRVKMKTQVIKIAKSRGADLRNGIREFVKEEFSFNRSKDNLRKYFEQLAFPVRLNACYNKFLEECEKYPERLFRRQGYSRDEIEGMVEDGCNMDFAQMPDAILPKFGSHYDIQGMFPLRLMDRYLTETFVPIDFKSEASEKKFLISGLHSGGKSFFLENLILTSIIGQVGLYIPAKSLTLPKYNKIFYYRNVDNHRSGEGKLESELNALKNIINRAGSKDLIVIDEFLDSTNAEIASALSLAILDKLMKSKSTVFVTSHRCTNYNQLANKGWILMSPEYIIEDDKIQPTLKLNRGPPNQEVNTKYVLEKYRESFSIK